MILVYIPCKDEEEAEKISGHLIGKKLIACANIFPVKSLYMWKGKLESHGETVIIAKSVKDRSEKIIEEAKKMHSYEIPCIEIIESRANREYEIWIEGELT